MGMGGVTLGREAWPQPSVSTAGSPCPRVGPGPSSLSYPLQLSVLLALAPGAPHGGAHVERPLHLGH